MVWTRLWERLRAWRGPKRQITLELTPEEQIAVRFLTEFGQATEDDVFQEVAARRWTEAHKVSMALFDLQVKGIARLADRGHGVRYYPTERAYEVRRILPAEATSTLQVYLTVAAPPGQRQGPS